MFKESVSEATSVESVYAYSGAHPPQTRVQIRSPAPLDRTDNSAGAEEITVTVDGSQKGRWKV